MRRWLKECTVREMGTTEAAWLAGFFDGEGCLTSSLGGHKGKYRSCIISVSNTHLPSLEYCKQVTGAGSVIKKADATDNHKAKWVWQVQSQRNIASILRQLAPYLVTKREKAAEYLS